MRYFSVANTRATPSAPLRSNNLLFFRPESFGGVSVTAEAALSIPAWFRAVMLIADSIAQLPMETVRVDARTGNRTPAPNHPAYNLLRYEPSPYYSSFTFVQTLLIHALVLGNGMAYIIRRPDGRVEELRLLDPASVVIREDEEGIFYVISGMNREIRAQDMIHVRGLGSWDGLMGLDLLYLHRRTIQQILANDELLTKFFQNGAYLSGILKHPQKLSQEQVEALTTSFKKAFGGQAKAGGTPVLSGGMEYERVQMGPVESGSLENKSISVDEVARIYGIPEFMLGSLENATLNNWEQGMILFKMTALQPRVVELTHELNRKVFAGYDKWKYQVDISLENLSLADLESKSKYMTSLFQAGVATTNELRRKVGLEDIDGGDERYVPANFVPSDLAGQQFQNQTDEPDEPDEAEEDDGERALDLTGMKINGHG